VEHLVLFEDGDSVAIESGEAGLRYLLIAGEPIGEPVAWYGPIVMNEYARGIGASVQGITGWHVYQRTVRSFEELMSYFRMWGCISTITNF
jgi:hypothetical protein